MDVSWDESNRVRQRLQAEVDRFDRLWSSREDGVITEDVSDLVYEQLAQYQGMEDCPGMVDQKEDSQLPEGFEGWALSIRTETSGSLIPQKSGDPNETDI